MRPRSQLVPEFARPYARKVYRSWQRLRGGGAAPAGVTRHYAQFQSLYGDFHVGRDYEDLAIRGLDKPSGCIRGSIVHFCRELPKPRRALLPGEPSSLREVYASMLGIEASAVVTAGLMDDADFRWDFEQDPPDMGRFDLALSQAMLEHLIDPYKHMRDLAALLEPGGHIVALTVLPGFNYHRYPVDCFRFFPDWFEEVAKRLSLEVVDRFIWELRVVYVLRKPAA
jgi:Methyltransferase domain